jgi:hypothetical protein
MKNFPKALAASSRNEATLDSKRLVLAFRKPTTAKEVSVLIQELNLVLENNRNKDEENEDWNQVNHTATRYWVKSADGSDITDKEYAVIQSKLKAKLSWIGPVYGTSQSEKKETKFCPLPNVILIEKSEKQKKQQNEFIKKFNLAEVPEKSKYLSKHRYLMLQDMQQGNAYQLRSSLSKTGSAFGTIRFENMPMLKPLTATIPNDTLWTDQWNMTQINAPDAWDISTGVNTVVICILDWGCDLTHPDLQFSEAGINLGTMLPDGSPTASHGTACAGIASATFNNNAGVAGLAGNCLIMPLAFDAASDVEAANGINYASTNGAGIISMSFGIYLGNAGFDYDLVSTEIENAHTNDVVMCAATANDDLEEIAFPAVHPLVIACGATSTDDNRKTPSSPDGETTWGSNYGDVVYDGVTTGVSVVAPGVLIPTTDRQGASGYEPGDYVMDFNGTSSATPLVAGLAGLIRSEYPALTNVQVRNIIERTAAKVGTLAYAETAEFLNGTRNEEMGYGRIDAFRGLDFADVLIKDWSGDDGTEPSSPPSNNWWSYSDIVVRITDDNVFDPSDPAKSKHVERGQTNYIYVKVTNNGPHDARNVLVDFRITPYVGLQFVYPDDWTLEDSMHVKPTPVTASFASIASGASVIAKFTISSAQTDALYGWQYVNPWHPCLLAMVTSDNDYAFAASDLSFGNLVLRKNNIAQRNLSVIDVLASPSAATAVSSPFVAGNLANMENRMFIEVDRSKLPAKAKVYLSLDDDGDAFPLVDFAKHDEQPDTKIHPGGCHCSDDKLVFLNRTKVKTRFGCCDGVLTLEKGSILKFSCVKEQQAVYNIKGGNLLMENGKRYIELTNNRMQVEMEKSPAAIFPMSVKVILPSGLTAGDQYSLSVSQRNQNRKTVGGADTVYRVV